MKIHKIIGEYEFPLKDVPIHVILSEAKNLREDDVFLRDSSLRSE